MDFHNIFEIFNTNPINVFGVVIFTLFIYFMKYSKETSKREKFISLSNGPKKIPFFGNSLNFILHPEEIATSLIDFAKKYGSSYRLWIGQKLNIVIANPKDAGDILLSSKFLDKGDDFCNIFGRALGTSTFSSKETNWRKSRKILQHSFKNNVLDDYTQIMNEEAVRIVKNLQSRANTSESFDVLDYIGPATINTVCRTLFNFEERVSEEEYFIFREAEAAYFDDSFYLMFQPKLVRNVLQIFAGKKCENVVTKMEMTYRKGIAEGKFNGKRRDDKNDESNENFMKYLLDEAYFSEYERKSNIISYTIGGSETASVTVSFVLLLLGMYQEIQDKVYDELKRIFGKDTNTDVTLDDIKQMTYLEQVLKEGMRLFPLVPFFFRTAKENTKLGNLNITAGTQLIIDVWSIHYNSQCFPNPEKFDPERFSEERSKHLPKGCFMPFNIGPRNCIAKAFAMNEMKIICSIILRKFRIHTAMKREDIKLKLSIVLANVSGNIISISERK